MQTPKSYIKPSVVIDSLRDSGYRNTAYAVAELIDNSIQAGAKIVRFVCYEKYIRNENGNNRREIQHIALLDDGNGMSAEVLHLALEFGGSKNKYDVKGMGKFGMGLPNSSISQCLKTEVWSWEKNNNPLYTFLDIDATKNKGQETIPEPTQREIPSEILASYGDYGLPESGTIVLWSNLDRLHWKTSSTIKKHTEKLIGRMYREYINPSINVLGKYTREKVRIIFQVYLFNEKTQKYDEVESSDFKANDPMFLSKDTILPALPDQVKNEQPFEIILNDPYDVTLPDGSTGTYTIKASVLKKEVCDAIREKTSGNIGGTDWGKNFRDNIGLSVVRAGRELDLLRHFRIKNDYYKDRYIGVEISFSPSLDKLFGVTNNKQEATNIKPIDIKELALMDADSKGINIKEKSEAGIVEDYVDNLSYDDPYLAKLIPCIQKIDQAFDDAFNRIKNLNVEGVCQPKETSENEIRNIDPVDQEATFLEQQREEHEPIDESSSPDPEELTTTLQDKLNIPSAVAKQKAEEIIKHKLKVHFEEGEYSRDILFDVSSIEGFTLIQLNKNHVFYKKFIASASDEDRALFKISLAAWARMEKEAKTTQMKDSFGFTRERWGRILSDYLHDPNE